MKLEQNYQGSDVVANITHYNLLLDVSCKLSYWVCY